MAAWNLSIDDTSQWLTYEPYYDGAQEGWTQWYTGSRYEPGVSGLEAASGDSRHLSNGTGSVSLTFYGTGVQIQGSANASYTVQLDSSDATPGEAPGDGLLFNREDLRADVEHNVSLSCNSKGGTHLCIIDNIVILHDEYDGLNWTVVDNSDAFLLDYAGNWIVDSWRGVPNATMQATFTRADLPSSSVSMKFTGGRAVAIYGSTTHEHKRYTVSLNGQQDTRNAYSGWLLGNSLKYYRGGLSENEEYTITVGPADNARFCLNSIRVLGDSVYVISSSRTSDTIHASTQASSITSSTAQEGTSTSPRIEVIVGPIFGGLATILVVAGLLLYCRTRVRDTPKFVSQEGLVVEPFLQPGSSAQSFRSKQVIPPPSSGEQTMSVQLTMIY
ncbi:hypothetical protein BD626DRAFT_398357 [Schizophyllum amplum]|uniref:Transmembrane protein n=1 Tax=Schizophyllum amplum TaxID=97359 RepID=A0A550CNG3_9AGAR|nr:hypothetical protein BD626DRAFT_398357 [Auriculariopsis ampla]